MYTPEQRFRRDRSRWTLVQGLLAPLQFLVFGISLFLVLRYFNTGAGADWATGSILLKTAILYTIMITGCLWERDVFGCYLFAPAFFWEDAVSMVVIALHTLYVALYLTQFGSLDFQMKVALLAYAVYVVNALQFLYKLRIARLQKTTGDITQ